MLKRFLKLSLIYSGLFFLPVHHACYGQELPRFNIDAIPALTALQDTPCEFFVHWDDESADFVATFDREPAGGYQIEASSSTDWLFSFTPDAADKMPFLVTITAESNGEAVSHSFTITPIVHLPPEQDVFPIQSHTQPGTVGETGIEIFDSPSLVHENFNYSTRITHKLRIIGQEVVFEQGNENGLYESYNNRRDIKQFEIIAERVIIRSPLHLKETDVIINARELRFEGQDAEIITTPEEKTGRPPFVNDGTAMPGSDGLKAGDVEINIESFYTDSGDIHFDLSGGAGQPCEDGQDGVNGVSVDSYWKTFEWTDSGIHFSWTAPGDQYIIYEVAYCTCAFGIPIFAFERGTKNGYPTDGTDAIPPGEPGDGGDAGILISNFPLDPYVLHNAGAPGAPGETPYNRGYYRGGYAGLPHNWVKKKANYCFSAGFSTLSSGTTEPGSNASLNHGSAGTAPAFPPMVDQPYTWLNSYLLNMVLSDARNAYISGRIDYAEQRLNEYSGIMEEYQTDVTWNDLSPDEQYELLQMYDEMQILLHRIEDGLDYFGNSPGWVPMLSFEVNAAAFDQEVDRSINMLYLAYWITNKAHTEQQRVDALSATRDQLRLEMEQAKLDYDDAAARIPVMRNKAQEMQTRTEELQIALETKETELRSQAVNNTRPPWWEVGIRMGLKTAGTICSMIPVYPPLFQTIGSGLTLASNFDPDQPWDTIIGAADITTDCFSTMFDNAVEDQQNKLKGIDPNSAESKKIEYLGAMRDASKGMSAGLTDMKGFLSNLEAPAEEIDAELEKLKSESGEYKYLVQQIKDLLKDKYEFMQELAAVMQRVADLSNTITQDIIAIDAMNRDISAGIAVLDPKATMYLEKMERRAYDRLLKYHYYMAKAYEYRLLKPYTGKLDSQSLINKFEEIADLNSDHSISPEQFNTLKSIYKDQLAAVAETILDDYNANRPELSVPVRFNLTEGELEKLNSGESVSLNLMNLGIFPLSDENIRIVGFKVYSISTVPVGGDYGTVAYVDLKIEHSGISFIKSEGEVLQFRHYNKDTTNPIVWGARFDPVDEIIDPVEPSAASDSLLRSLLGGNAPDDIMLYSRPSAWTDLAISRSVTNNNGLPINITGIRLELIYDFTPQNTTLDLVDIMNNVSMAYLYRQDDVAVEDADFTPYFVLDMPDVNHRQDARGRFFRIFAHNSSGYVTITAQPRYGNWYFNKWTNRYGFDLPGGPFNSPEISLALTENQAVSAQYIAQSLYFDINTDGDVDGTDLYAFAEKVRNSENGLATVMDFANNFGHEQNFAGPTAEAFSPDSKSAVSNGRNIEWIR